jgi:mannosyl-glycoprotein endo-beta-N-acetylglucosaminidase
MLNSCKLIVTQWPREFPSLSAQYFLSLDSSLTGNTVLSLQDIYTGVDVWGRGCHGGGGFGSYKAITHIDPEFLGLSVALFGQAWTWETEEGKLGWTWEKWWEYERKLWIGPEDAGEVVTVPEVPSREGEPVCVHGPFLPIKSFFPRLPPPNPKDMGLFTMFSPGVGRAWFVEGVKVLQTTNGWTDIHKQGTLGDMVWPRPQVSWEGDEHDEQLPKASAALYLDDAWNGGNCLRLELSGLGSTAEHSFFRCFWLPIQSLAVTPHQSYQATAVYKVESGISLDLDIGLSVKLLTDTAAAQPVQVKPRRVSHADLHDGWTKLSLQFIISSDCPIDVLGAIGLVIGIVTEDPTQDYKLSLLMGQLAVFPTASSQVVSSFRPAVLWADFERRLDSVRLAGILTWEISTSFPLLPINTITSVDDPAVPWNPLPVSERWFPSFIYFNIYIGQHGDALSPEKAVFIGTTGLDGRANRFYVDPECLPRDVDGKGGVRFYVQGVTDRGEVLRWDQCVFVDVEHL